MASSRNNADSPRRNLPRGGEGKYKWTPQPHHAIQWQKDWLNLATKLFNIDEDDVLLTSREKNEVLSLLAKRITDSNIAVYGRAVGSCKIVDTVRKICAGKEPLVEVNVFTALLRYSLKPPMAWLDSEAVRHRLEALKYLERCANGIEIYSAETLKNAMPKEAPAAVTPGQRGDTSRGTVPSRVCTASTNIPDANTPNRPSVSAVRPWTRAVTRFMTPTQPSNKRKATSEPPPQSKTTPSKESTNSKKTTTPKRLVTPKKGTSNHTAQIGPKNYKSATQTRSETGSPTSNLVRTRRDRCTAAEPLHACTNNVLLASIFKATEVIDKIARYEDVSVRKVALSTFIADLQKAGWGDLEKLVEQLIKDEDHTSRAFLAGVIVSSTYERINDAVDINSKPSRNDPIRPASGGRRHRILFKSC
ncbi:hypothetical protein CI238_09738 [Colletotrichum incanum]|uniref:Uncharacterized protein n=1 Tax=Colletotrichum incanum TaxID=1573173 RepID=A0A161WBC9_COLIC|nr:hypothetical protein CI238_09738 [Colletotrichum incanum]OHW94793.1 hypothetical protein CSPAE12_06612 [Colletotrichum incanum]